MDDGYLTLGLQGQKNSTSVHYINSKLKPTTNEGAMFNTAANSDENVYEDTLSMKYVSLLLLNCNKIVYPVKGVLHLWALFLKTLCIFSKNKATSDKVSYGSGQKCSKELENYSFTSVETIVVKLQWKMCENQYFPCFEP